MESSVFSTTGSKEGTACKEDSPDQHTFRGDHRRGPDETAHLQRQACVEGPGSTTPLRFVQIGANWLKAARALDRNWSECEHAIALDVQ